MRERTQFLRSKIQANKLEEMESEFLPLLVSCLQDCAGSRWGLFGQNDHLPDARWLSWPEAEHVRELAQEIQAIRVETAESNPVCDRFLVLCSVRGPNVPGEPKLAAAFLAEMRLA
jgi:hypothetical protein